MNRRALLLFLIGFAIVKPDSLKAEQSNCAVANRFIHFVRSTFGPLPYADSFKRLSRLQKIGRVPLETSDIQAIEAVLKLAEADSRSNPQKIYNLIYGVSRQRSITAENFRIFLNHFHTLLKTNSRTEAGRIGLIISRLRYAEPSLDFAQLFNRFSEVINPVLGYAAPQLLKEAFLKQRLKTEIRKLQAEHGIKLKTIDADAIVEDAFTSTQQRLLTRFLIWLRQQPRQITHLWHVRTGASPTEQREFSPIIRPVITGSKAVERGVLAVTLPHKLINLMLRPANREIKFIPALTIDLIAWLLLERKLHRIKAAEETELLSILENYAEEAFILQTFDERYTKFVKHWETLQQSKGIPPNAWENLRYVKKLQKDYAHFYQMRPSLEGHYHEPQVRELLLQFPFFEDLKQFREDPDLQSMGLKVFGDYYKAHGEIADQFNLHCEPIKLSFPDFSISGYRDRRLQTFWQECVRHYQNGKLSKYALRASLHSGLTVLAAEVTAEALGAGNETDSTRTQNNLEELLQNLRSDTQKSSINDWN